MRRHGWSPDGSILLLVSGLQKDEAGNIEHVVWGFSREDLSKPSFYLPTLDKSPVCLRFCPIIFKKDDNSSSTDPGNLKGKKLFLILFFSSQIFFNLIIFFYISVSNF